MSRISEAELQRIKRRPVAEVAAELGIVTKPRGKDLVAKCPLHDDEEPSLVLTPSKNVWHCFGCQAGGSVIDLVMRVRNLSFRHAVEVLRGEDELDLVLDDDQTLLHQVVGYYHRTLKESSEAIAYAKKRGLSKEAIEDFKIGYANRTLSYRLPAKTTKRGLELRARLQSLGVFRESGREHLNGSLVVPVVVDGKVVQLYGRKIRDDLRKGTPKHLYLLRPFEGVFNREHLDGEKVIVCESLLDALTFYSASIKNVTCTFGTSGMTKELRKFLEDKHTLIAFDNDDAGNKAAAKLLEEVPRATRVELPKGMDVNEYALTMQPREKALRLLVAGETREPVVDESQQEQPKPLDADSPRPDTQDPDDLTFKFDTRSYRVRGLTKKTLSGLSSRCSSLTRSRRS